MDFYTKKIESAKAIINDHNSHLPKHTADSDLKTTPHNTIYLSWESILAKLQAMGGTTEETLREMTWEDIQDAGVPRVLARRIANQVFRK